jgi:hypothetical protein
MIGFRPIGGYLSGLTNFNSAHRDIRESQSSRCDTCSLFKEAYGDRSLYQN